MNAPTSRDEDARLGESIAEVLAVGLAEQPDLVLVERGKLTEVVKEQQLALTGLIDPATAARVGRLLAADLVLSGSIVATGERLRLTVHAVAVEGQQILGTAEAEGTRQELDRMALQVAGRMTEVAGVKLPAVKPEELDDSPVGRLHLMRGISLYYANNPDQAIASLLRAVQLDPRLQEARLWIARAYLQQGEGAHARTELRQLTRNPAAKPLAAQIDQLLRESAPPGGK